MRRAAAMLACASLVWAHARAPAAASQRHSEETLIAVSAPRHRAEQGRSPCQIDLVRPDRGALARAPKPGGWSGALTGSDWRRCWSAV